MVKQKLIRLTANSQDLIGKQCIFEATYNDGILIDENSQVALLSATLSRSVDNLVVNSFNDLITFQTATGNTQQINIPHGNYDGNTFNLLLDGIQDAINEELSILPLPVDAPSQNGREQGMHVEVLVNDQNAVQIEIRRTKQVNAMPNSNIQLTNGVGIGSALGWYYSLLNGSQTLQRDTPASGTNLFVGAGNVQDPMSSKLGTTSYIYSPIPLSKGAGQLAVQLDFFLAQDLGIAPGGSGVIVGLLPKTDAIMKRLQNLTNPDDRIKPNEFVYGISTNNNGSNLSPYQIKTPSNSEFIDTTVNPVNVSTGDGNQLNNDIISIRVSQGGVQLVIADTTMGVDTSPFFEDRGRVVYNGNYLRRDANLNEIEYIPYVGVYGTQAYTRLGQIQCNLMTDPVNTELMVEDGIGFGAGAVGDTPLCRTIATISKFNIIFAKESIANYLGFSETNLSPGTEPKVAPPVLFIAESPRTKIYNTNTYLVEMLSESLDSYDSFEQGRKSILSAIPISERTISAGSGIIQFQPNNLVFIDLKNRKQRLIRNMRARIVTDTYDPIEIEGLAEINIIIRSQ